jgi:tetratricopeptide (TPR) repeat protein
VQGFIKAILEERPPSPRRLNRQVPHDLATIVLRCLEKDPADRYASAGDLADDLDRFLAGERILAKPRGILALGVDAVRRHRVAALGAIAALAVPLVLVLGGRAAKQTQRLEVAERLKRISLTEDADVAVSEIEDLLASEPGDAAVRALRATIYHKRAMKTLDLSEPLFDEVLEDLDRAGEQGSFWHLMALVEAGRIADAKAAAEALPAASPLRNLALARVAVAEGRYEDAIGLLPEPVEDPQSGEATVFAALSRGLAHRGLGQREDAARFLKLASEHGNRLTQPWLRARAAYTFLEGGGDPKDFLASLGLASLGRTVTESLLALVRFAEKTTADERRIAQRLVDSVLKLANQSPVPLSTLKDIARDRLAKAEGKDRAVAHLLLAIAELNLERRDLALGALDAAEEESVPTLDPYIYWVRALVQRVEGDLPLAVESAQQAIELALALPETFADLEPLCEHASLLAKEAPPDQRRRASEFLREKLRGMPPGTDWVSAMLARLSGAPAPER